MSKIVDGAKNFVNGAEDWFRWLGKRRAAYLTGIGLAVGSVVKSGLGGDIIQRAQEYPGYAGAAIVGLCSVYANTGKDARTFELSPNINHTFSHRQAFWGSMAIAGLVAGGITANKVWIESDNAVVAGPTSEFTLGVAEQGDCEIDIANFPNDRDEALLVQLALHNREFNVGPLDGIFGETSRTALIAFQTSQGITADGEFGRETCGKIAEFVDNKPNPPVTSGE